MYHGNNPVAKRSQDWLADAFLKLLKIKPYSQITIKEICDLAGLSRQTFYQMFDGKDEVARHAVHCNFHLTVLCHPSNLAASEWVKAVIQQLAHAVRENKELILLYQKNHLQYILHEDISIAVSKLESKVCRPDSLYNRPLNNAFFTGALAHSLLFLAEHEDISDEEFADFFCDALKGKYCR